MILLAQTFNFDNDALISLCSYIKISKQFFIDADARS